MYDMGGKLLNSIKSMYIRVIGEDSECFRINSDVRQGYITFP